jgi:agmatinase/guanidinopropionase
MAGHFTPVSGRALPRFAGVRSFFRLPLAELSEAFDVAIMGVAHDAGTSYRPGARFAPAKIRDVSALGRAFHMSRERNWVEALDVADIGDCPVNPLSQEETYTAIEAKAAEVFAAGKRLISVGGDHSTTLPLLRAASRAHGRLNFIHFDAHLDTYPAAWGQEYHHGAFARHAVEEGLVDPARMLQIGIRGPLAGSDDLDFPRAHGIRVTTVDDVRDMGIRDFCAALPAFADGPTYVSFDIDCLDPAYAPGTGTPVPGGLTTFETQRILRALRVGRLVAADVVEVSPPYDSADITALAAVDVLFEYLAMLAGEKLAGRWAASA